MTCDNFFWFLPSATITNPLTNLMHGLLLFTYMILSYRKYLEGKVGYNIVLLFLLMFITKFIGVYLHLLPRYEYSVFWFIASILFIVLFLLFGISFAKIVQGRYIALIMSDRLTQAALLISLIIAVKFNLLPHANFDREVNYNYLALILLIQSVVFIIKTQKTLRFGFVLLLIANITWGVLPQIFYYYGCLSERNSYFIDVYHFLLMFATFVLYKGCINDSWIYPTKPNFFRKNN